MNPHRKKAYFELLIASVIWGVAGPIIKYTLGGLSTLNFLTYRFALSVFAAVVISIVGKTRLLPKGKNLWLAILYGFITSTVALGLLFFGLEKTTALDMTFLTLLEPLLITIAGTIFLKERVTKIEKVGIGLALLGSLITTLQPLFETQEHLSQISGSALIFVYLFVNAASVVIAKKLIRAGESAITLTNTSFIVGFISILPLSLVFSDPINAVSNLAFPYHLGVIFMAFISGNLAYILWVKAQKTIEIGEASLFGYLYPLFATPLAVFWLGEKITPTFIVGAAIITIGVIIAEYKKS